MTNQAPGDEPVFFVHTYVTITRDPRTQLVVAIGGDDRAASILQRGGGFLDAPGPRGPYHRQPHSLPAEERRRGATAAALALLQAGYSVHLDPDLNTLSTRDEDRQAAHRYLDLLAERARNPSDGHELAAILTEIVAPGDGVLPRLRDILLSLWAGWDDRLPDAGHPAAPAEQLIDAVNGLARHTQRLEDIRNQAARIPASAPSPSATAKPVPATPGRGR
ncbi:hypothetical protein ACKI1I_17430 [Streptomyces turgidiscabies]|uniref:hypothetical protein n=1 Tax=Streptomyces turgidiscabies TaxID=85558 RepID=UPI0038F608C2